MKAHSSTCPLIAASQSRFPPPAAELDAAAAGPTADVPLASTMNAPPQLSAACIGWAKTARYETRRDGGVTILQPEDRDRGTYRIRWRNPGQRVEITEIDAEDNEEELVYAANIVVAERFLFGLLGDELRDDLDLTYLELPTRARDIAPEYHIGDMYRGYRTLTHHSRGPVAASRDDTLSLVRLVPLSHFLSYTVDELKMSYLSDSGYPLLTDGRYRIVAHHRAEPTES